jgi:hypothetical protein
MGIQIYYRIAVKQENIHHNLLMKYRLKKTAGSATLILPDF